MIVPLAAALIAALLAVAPAATPAAAATILSRTIHLVVGEDGAVTERVALRVRLDEAGDLARWSPYPIVLDVNRTLISASGWARRPDGSRVVLGDDDVESVEGLAGGGLLHTSTELRLLRFPPLPAGSELAVAYEVEERPWLPGGSIELLGEVPVERLSVVIDGAAAPEPGLRWLFDGVPEAGDPGGEDVAEVAAGEGSESAPTVDPDPDQDPEGGSGSPLDRLGLTVEETPGSLRVEGVRLPAVAADEEVPVLRYSWGPVRSWPDVARWYEEIVHEVPRNPEAVRRMSRELTGAVGQPRARVAAALDFVRRRIRYVAVEVGVGGYRPSPPADVLERRWGDCKDKSFLLLDLLAAAGVEAHPALVLLDDQDRVDDRFPGADQFNHVIVAVPREAVAAGPEDVVADGYLFLDATQDRGGLTWIHPFLQGQRALVVAGDDSRLVALPVLTDRETNQLEVRLTVEPSGDASGEARLALVGHGGWALATGTASASQERLSAVARRLLGGVLDGATIGTPRWREGEGDGVPTVELTAPVYFSRLVMGRSVRSMELPGPEALTELSELGDRTGSVRPVRWSVVWELALPRGWCPPREPEIDVANDLGSFRQRLTTAPDGAARVEREAELAVRWVEPEMAEMARELALAERRALRRRLRLECDTPSSQGEENPPPGTT